MRNAAGRELAHSLSGGRLRIELGEGLTGGREETVNVEFSGSPRRGLYFIGPDDAYPNKRLEAWTQGQDEDSRHWFPCYDYPNEMATSEIHVTVREPFTAIANGELRGVDTGPDSSKHLPLAPGHASRHLPDERVRRRVRGAEGRVGRHSHPLLRAGRPRGGRAARCSATRRR